MYINLHTHTDHSNYRLLDSINTVSRVLKYSQELGHNGIAITDHETVGSHMEALHTYRDLVEKEPEKWENFKLILGNEIYLCDRYKIQELKEYIFPHFILLAKNLKGHRALRELSTIAWCENSFTWVNMRVPTFKDDLKRIMRDYKGDIIAGTACAGGELPKLILKAYNLDSMFPNLIECDRFIEEMIDIFGQENFYLELQPSIQPEQEIINKALIELAHKHNLLYVITTDAHYLLKSDRKIHESFLNSQEADREVGDFYTTTYLMSEEEIHEYLDESLGYDVVQTGLDNTIKIANTIERYTLDKPLDIPYVPDDITEPDVVLVQKYRDSIPLLTTFATSKYPSDRHLVREIVRAFEAKPEEFNNKATFDAVQTNLLSIKLASDKQNTPWSAYLLQTKELIKICWEAGSLVSAGRGSGVGFILLYILGITQINPLRETVSTFHWRFLNPERVSPLDIDVDTMGSKKADIIAALQKKYGGYRHVMKVQTLLKTKAKNSLQTAARGLGYPPEEGVYLSSFVQAERGLQYTLSQLYYGDEENGLKPNTEFVNLMNDKYHDIWEVAQRIEGLVIGCGQHAGGVILTAHDCVDDIALMKTKGGDVITQFDLHSVEAASAIKWDLLNVDCLEKINIELNLLLADGVIEDQGSLKKTYDKYLNVYGLDRDNPEVWDLICNHKILSLFQFEKNSGYQAIELGQPRSLEAMSALNSVMRLMATEKGGETPLQRYARFRKNINEWYDEMTQNGLTQEEQDWVKTYAAKNYGLLPNQENFMEIVQDKRMGGFSLLWADKLRKSIAKKNPKAFNELEAEFFANVEEKHLSPNLCKYVWKTLISANKGYGFNTSHTLAYSIVALQEANLAYRYPIIYWNCANLISDSGGFDSTVSYDKIAAAVSRIRKEGISITPPYINEARFDFRPDAKNNQIIYGLKPINGVGAAQAAAIVANQPYTSLKDFQNKIEQAKLKAKEKAENSIENSVENSIEKTNTDESTESVNAFTFGDSAMIQLIKSGAFDKIENKPRQQILEEYIRKMSKPLKSLTIRNIEDLYKLNKLSESEIKNELRWTRFKTYVFKNTNIAEKLGKTQTTFFYKLDQRFSVPYFIENFAADLTEGKDFKYNDDGDLLVKRGSLERLIDKKLKNFQTNTLSNPENLAAVNEVKFRELWNEKAGGSLSQWEMESMNYYWHPHELANVNCEKYDIVNFEDLSPEPIVVPSREPNNSHKPQGHRYKLSCIAGTVIAKDKNHNTVSILTTSGVVVVKLYAGEFGFYSRDVVEQYEVNGKTEKVVIDESWFSRGKKLLITGFRRDDQFVVKRYRDSVYSHTIQLIKDVDEKGQLSLVYERANQSEADGQ